MANSTPITLNLTEASLTTIRVRSNVSTRVNQILARYAAIVADAKALPKDYLMPAEIELIRETCGAFQQRGGGSFISMRAQVAVAIRSAGGGETLAQMITEMPMARFVALLEWVEQQPVAAL